MKIKLSDAQRSAIECAGLDFEQDRATPVERAWQIRGWLHFSEREREALAEQLNDMSNAEDATAEQEKDRTMAKLARRASRALATISSKVRQAKEKR